MRGDNPSSSPIALHLARNTKVITMKMILRSIPSLLLLFLLPNTLAIRPSSTVSAVQKTIAPSTLFELLLGVASDDVSDECKTALTGSASSVVVEQCQFQSYVQSGADEHLETPHLDPMGPSDLDLERTCRVFAPCSQALEDFFISSVDACGHQSIFDFAMLERGFHALNQDVATLLLHLPLSILSNVRLTIHDMHAMARFALGSLCATDRNGGLCAREMVKHLLGTDQLPIGEIITRFLHLFSEANSPMDLLSSPDLLCSECFGVELAVLASHSTEKIWQGSALDALQLAWRAVRSACPGGTETEDMRQVARQIGEASRETLLRQQKVSLYQKFVQWFQR